MSPLIQLITSIPSSLISYLSQAPPPPPLLPIANTVAAVDPQPIAQNMHNLQLAMSAFILATTATLELVSSEKFLAADQALNLAIVGFMAAAALLLNGILFGKLYIQALGINLCLLSIYALVASFILNAFSCACWLSGAFCLMLFLYLLISKPQPAPA